MFGTAAGPSLSGITRTRPSCRRKRTSRRKGEDRDAIFVGGGRDDRFGTGDPGQGTSAGARLLAATTPEHARACRGGSRSRGARRPVLPGPGGRVRDL